MLGRYLKYFISLVILLHCLGATQLASAYLKDGSTFTSMLNMTEEETKKEKEGKDDTEYTWETKPKHLFTSPAINTQAQLHFTGYNILTPQYLADNPSPPPDLA